MKSAPGQPHRGDSALSSDSGFFKIHILSPESGRPLARLWIWLPLSQAFSPGSVSGGHGGGVL